MKKYNLKTDWSTLATFLSLGLSCFFLLIAGSIITLPQTLVLISKDYQERALNLMIWLKDNETTIKWINSISIELGFGL